jgi:hypothetical protein
MAVVAVVGGTQIQQPAEDGDAERNAEAVV